MNQHPIRGRMLIRSANLESDLQFLREHVARVSVPRRERLPGSKSTPFWRIEFAAAPAQWRAIEPELAGRGISVTFYRFEQEPEQNQGWRVSKAHLLFLLGVLVFIAGYAGYVLARSHVISLTVSAIGIGVMSLTGKFKLG